MRKVTLGISVAVVALMIANPSFAGGKSFSPEAKATSESTSGALAGAAVKADLEAEVEDSGNSHVENDLTNKLRNNVENDLNSEQTLVGLQKTKTKTGDVGVDIRSDDDTTTNILTINPQALANLPTANCQGESDTAGIYAANPTIGGGGITFGSSEESEQCNVRENIKLVASLEVATKDEMRLAMSKLTGFEHLAPVVEEDTEVDARSRSYGEVEQGFSDRGR